MRFLFRCLTRNRDFSSFRRTTKVYNQSLIQCNDEHYNLIFCMTCRRFLQSSASQTNVFKSPRPPVDLPVVPLSDYMFSRFSAFGNKKALVDDASGTVYTYSQLEDLSRKVGSFLYRKGFSKNDVICYYGTNTAEFGLLLLGCASVGVVMTTANPAYTSGELKRHMEHSGAKLLVTVEHLVPKAQGAGIKNMIVIGNANGCQPFSDMLSDDGKYFPTDITFDPHEDVVIMPYSSGTTGLPKGVMLTHYNVVSNMMQLQQSFCTTTDDTNFAVLPFFHIYGIVVLLCGTLQTGGTLAISPGFEPETFLNTIREQKVTQLHVVPPLLLFLTHHPLVDKFDFSRIRTVICGAAPLGEAISNEFMEKRNKVMRQAYGMTETALTCADYESITTGTVGPLTANTDAKFVDPQTGKSLGRNETGELLLRGPQNMKGYINNEKATKEMIDEDGWLRTGDIGHIRDNDCIVITDRLKELIKYKAYQVAPAELEDLLHKHPAVHDVAVIGMPDDQAGELPRAYVVQKPTTSLQAHDILKYVEQNVSEYKRLRGGVEFVREIPKSPSGKILRRVLKDQLKSP